MAEAAEREELARQRAIPLLALLVFNREWTDVTASGSKVLAAVWSMTWRDSSLQEIVAKIRAEGLSGRPAWESLRGVLVALGRLAVWDQEREAVATAIIKFAEEEGGRRVMATDDVRGVLLAMGREGGDRARMAVAATICHFAFEEDDRQLVTRDDVRDVLVAMGSAAQLAKACAMVALAIWNIAFHSLEGRRLVARDDVRDVLVAMAARCDEGESRRSLAMVLSDFSRQPDGGRLMVREEVCDALLALGGSCGGDELRDADGTRKAVAAAIGALALAEPTPWWIARGEVRALLVGFGRATEDDEVRGAVATAVGDVAASEAGRRVMATEAVCAMLGGMLALFEPQSRQARSVVAALERIG